MKDKKLVGLLIVNGFLKGEKYSIVEDILIKKSKEKDIELIIKNNNTLLTQIENCKIYVNQLKKNIDFVIFWDKDIFLAKALENMGLKLFNSSFATQACDDKRLTHFTLSQNNINCPKTVFVPFTFENIGYNDLRFLNNIEKKFNFPVIIKEAFGSFGMQVYQAEDLNQCKNIIFKIKNKPCLIQQKINSLTTLDMLNKNKISNAKEIIKKNGDISFDVRLCVVGEKVVASMLRYSINGDFRANVTNGGKMIKYYPTKEEENLALSACKALKLDFGGVDLLYDEDNIYVCEVNSNAHFKNISDCTGVDVAEQILSYTINKITK